MSRILISNTGPIIALAGVRCLHLLRELYGQVVVPLAVDSEIKKCAKSRIGLMEYLAVDWVEVRDQGVIDPLLPASLDFGEALF